MELFIFTFFILVRKCCGWVFYSFENEKGKVWILSVAVESLAKKLIITISKWKESENNSGDMTMTMDDMKIMYATADADISSFNILVSFKLSSYDPSG